MRRLIGLALIVLSLTLVAGIRSFAEEGRHLTGAEEGKHLTGTKRAVVTGIKDNTLEVKGKNGRVGSIPVSDLKILEGIKVGDHVKIHFENGQVTSVEKIEVTGTKRAVVTGIKDNTLRVRGENGRVGSIPVSDPKMLEGIKVGDYVKIHFEEGKVTSVEKIGDQMPARHGQEMPTATPKP